MKAVLFDFNGTLYNDTEFHRAAWRNFMKAKFGMELSEEEITAHYIGPNNSEIFQYCFGDRYSAEEVVQLGREKEVEYRSVARSRKENLQLMPGAPELFDLLVARGIPFALATASPIENVEFYLNDLGLKKWFTMDRIVYDEGILPSKPDPAFYLEAAKRIGVAPKDCVIAEDSITGIGAAINAGAGRIVAIDRSMSRDWLEEKKNAGEIHAIVHDFCGFERFL